MELKRRAQFLFENAMLKRTMRTGYAFLGSGSESAAAHSQSTAVAAMVLADMVDMDVDMERLLKMCIIHDLPEARTGDANAVHKLYVQRDEDRAMKMAVAGLAFGQELLDIYREYEEADSLEARIARDADQIDMIISLKEQLDTGNPEPARWLPHVMKRLVLPEARQLAEAILETHWASWWMEELLAER
jgi:putative hydrolase of HD superfamily